MVLVFPIASRRTPMEMPAILRPQVMHKSGHWLAFNHSGLRPKVNCQPGKLASFGNVQHGCRHSPYIFCHNPHRLGQGKALSQHTGGPVRDDPSTDRPILSILRAVLLLLGFNTGLRSIFYSEARPHGKVYQRHFCSFLSFVSLFCNNLALFCDRIKVRDKSLDDLTRKPIRIA